MKCVSGSGKTESQGVDQGREDFTGLRSCIGLRSEARFAGDDRRTELTLRPVVICRDAPIFDPMVETSRILVKEILNPPHAEMLGWLCNHLLDLLLQLVRLPGIVAVREWLGVKMHGRRQEGNQRRGESLNLTVIQKLLGEIFDLYGQAAFRRFDR